MSAAAWAELLVLIALLAISTPLLGNYMTKVFGGGRAPGDRVFLPVERVIYRLTGVDPDSEQRWQTYAISLLAFSFAMLEVSDSLILAQKQAFYPITKAIMELFQLLGDGKFIASALGVWAMVFLGVTIVGMSLLLGKKLGAIFRV